MSLKINSKNLNNMRIDNYLPVGRVLCLGRLWIVLTLDKPEKGIMGGNRYDLLSVNKAHGNFMIRFAVFLFINITYAHKSQWGVKNMLRP